MFRTLFWYASGWIALFISYPLLLLDTLFNKTSSKNLSEDSYADRFTRALTRFLFRTTGSSLKITGLENVPERQPVLFVSNHQSHVDSLVIHGFIDMPKGFVSVIEALNIPIIRTWMKKMICVFLDRNDLRQAFNSLEQCVDILKKGRSMVIYPEGRLDEGKEVLKFKKGCLKVAMNAEVPIIPVTIRNSCKVMNKNGTRIRAANVECIISEPVQVKGADKSEKELIQMVRDIIVSKL